MKYEEFMDTIVKSDYNDWTYDDDLGLYIYKEDITISIKSKRDDDIDKRFYEEWVKNYSDPKAYRSIFYLCFNGNTIKQFFTVAVDGYRMLIPYPKFKDMTISTEQDQIAKILNLPYTQDGKYMDRYEDYKNTAKIVVK